MKDEGPHSTALLRKDTRLPQRELMEWEDTQRLSFGVFVPNEIMQEEFWNDPLFISEMNSFSKDHRWNIHLGRPNDPVKLAPPTAEILPVFKIHGAEFWIDVERMELRDKMYSTNTISVLKDMSENGNGYQFHFKKGERRAVKIVRTGDKDVKLVKIPELVVLDPEGMARKYGLKMDEMAGKTDFDLIVDQQALQQRRAGMLVTVDIAGQIFFVDHRLRELRPKDDFSAAGIRFDDIEVYRADQSGTYIFPYDAVKHELRHVSNEILEIPKGLILVEIQSPEDMDRVGYNRYLGVDELSNLKETGVRMHYVARKVEWEEMGVDKLVQENIKKHIAENIVPRAKKVSAKKEKGRSRKF